MTRKERKLEQHRIEVLSSIAGEKQRIELMALRPRAAEDTLNTDLLKTVLERFAVLEVKAKAVNLADELEDLEDDAELQGLFAAYFCPANEISEEGNIAIDDIELWGVPKTAPQKLRDRLSQKLKIANANPHDGRGILYSIYAEADSWSDFIDDYEDTMSPYIFWLFWISVGTLLLAVVALYFASKIPFLVFIAVLLAGATGSCISVMSKTPPLDASLAGELNAYRRRVLARVGVGLIASLIGCGLLGWGIVPLSIQNQTFSDALNAFSMPSSNGTTIVKTLIVLAVPILLGFSERALTSFENRILGEPHSSAKKR